MAISLRAKITGQKRNDDQIIIHKPDLDEVEYFSLTDLTYTKPRDYYKSGIKICKNNGLTFSSGFECEISSQIPIRAGTSSSSAINVSWIHFLSKMADNPKEWNQQKIGELTYQSEVKEFNEPGGMMDQYATAMGHLIYLQSEPGISIQLLKPNLGSFVLGDSNEPKDTIDVLKRCRDSQQKIFQKLKSKNPMLNIHNCDKNLNLSDLKTNEIELYNGMIQNRDILKRVLPELEKDEPNHKLIGELLSEHHTILRDVLQVSTPKIESMIDAAMDAGALGGKINGSGGGGCMFAYAPDEPEKVAEAVKKICGNTQIIHSDAGTKILI